MNQPTDPDDSSCVPLTLEIVTDDYGYENVLALVDDDDEDGNSIWNESEGLNSNQQYQFSACVDPARCATLDIFDSWGDGIFSPGGITLTYDGVEVYSGSDFGSGRVFRLGDGC